MVQHGLVECFLIHGTNIANESFAKAGRELVTNYADISQRPTEHDGAIHFFVPRDRLPSLQAVVASELEHSHTLKAIEL